MNEIVKCANRQCGLIAALSNWMQVKTDNPLITKGHCPRCNGQTFFNAKPGEKETAKTGVQLIALERNRQLKIEGWSETHDDAHRHGELALAGASYAALAGSIVRFQPSDVKTIDPPRQWPWDCKWWKPSENNIKNLVRAGALIAAEIDRLQRLANDSKAD